MKRILITLAWLHTSVAHGGVPWSWLHRELAVNEQQQQRLQDELGSLLPVPPGQQHEHAGFHSGFAPSAASLRWVQLDLGAEYDLDAVVLVPALFGNSDAYGFPRRFRVDASNDPLFAESTTLLDQTGSDAPASRAPWYIDANKAKVRHVRITATELSSQPYAAKRFFFCLGEVLVFSGGRNIALHAETLAPKSAETLPTWSAKHLVDGCHALGLPVRPDDVISNGWHSAVAASADTTKWVQLDFDSPRVLQEFRLIPAHPRDFPDRFGFGFPRRFKIEADGHQIFDCTAEDFPNPGDTPVAIPVSGLSAQSLRITATRLWERSGDYVFALAEAQVLSGGKNAALEAKVSSLDDTVTAAWKHDFLVDGRSSSGVLIDEATWLKELSQARETGLALGLLDRQHIAAVAVARSRGAWLAGCGVIAVAGVVLMAIRRAKRSRKQELEVLRHRISRDLHDDIGSHLGSIRLMAELALRDGGAADSMEEIHRLAGEAAESMRGIIWLVREGDAPKLTSLVEAMRQSASTLLVGIDWHFPAPAFDESGSASLEFHRQVFLLFREVAHNIARHANAHDVKIVVSWRSKQFHLCIEDDGCGFDQEAVVAGNGLANLRHRAAALGGSLQIYSSPGKGTRITLEASLS